MAENKYQAYIIKKLQNEMFPGCLVLVNDPNHIQGIPDLTVLYKNKWAFIETKDYKGAKQQPNQLYYIKTANEMSFGRFLFPEDEDVVLYELWQHFMKD